MKFSFDVGIREKHWVEFSWNQLFGKTLIKVDGRAIHKSVSLFSSSKPASTYYLGDSPDKWTFFGQEIELIQKWEFDVGENEKCNVVIEKQRQKWMAGLRPQFYKVFVDGRLIKEKKGF